MLPRVSLYRISDVPNKSIYIYVLVRRVFIVGTPGARRLEVTKAIADDFRWKYISTAEAIRAEAEKMSPMGATAKKALDANKYVDDDIVIDLVAKEIQEAERCNQSYIIEGFPRTRIQAMAFAKLGVVPDKIIQLSVSEATSIASIKASITEASDVQVKISDEEHTRIASRSYREWDIN